MNYEKVITLASYESILRFCGVNNEGRCGSRNINIDYLQLDRQEFERKFGTDYTHVLVVLNEETDITRSEVETKTKYKIIYFDTVTIKLEKL